MSHPAPAVQAPQSNDQSLQQQKVQQAQRNGMIPMMPVQHMQPQFIPAQQPVDGDQKYYAAAPVYGQPAPQQPQPTDPQYGSRVLKISANSNPKNVAGAISHITRQGDCPAMLATGSASINQAIKAVAIARGYLEENKIELTCYPEFRSDKRTGLSLVLNKSVRRSPSTGNEESDKDVQQLKVSKGSNPNSVAGAIANKLRAGQRVWLLAIGADCVTHAVKSVAIGRKYLERDGMDISFRPEFTKVKFEDGRDCSALKFVILSQQVTPIADLVDIHPPQ